MIARKVVARACIAAAVSYALQSVRAHELEYTASLSGTSEITANVSPAMAEAFVAVDFDIVAMDVDVRFNGMTQPVSAAAIHGLTATSLAGSANVALPLPQFPAAVSGDYSHTIDLTTGDSYDAGYIASSGGTVSDALNTLAIGLVQHKMYLELASPAYPNGEIRGFLRTFPDANHDGTINTPDFNIVAAHFNEFGTEFDLGDFDLNVRTNALDFNQIAARFGDTINAPECYAPSFRSPR